MAPTNRPAGSDAPASECAALEIRALSKSYRTGLLRRERSALAGLELVLERGASTGLIGPNGSGKSTLLRIVAGIERPSAGSVAVFGHAPDESKARARTGYLPDGFPFPAELAPREVLLLLAGLHGFARRERARAAQDMLERVGLASEARVPLGRFSLGMKRRFGLAQAFLHRPDLLLLDEPSAGLDAPGYLVLEELLGEARARGATILCATHVLSDLQDHCPRACVLVQGRLAAEGPTGELVRDRSRLLQLYRDLSAPRAGEP